MHIITLLFTTATLLSTAYAQGDLFNIKDRFDAAPSSGCYCKLPEQELYSGNDIKELGVTKYCCDATAGVDDPNTQLKPGQSGNWDKEDRSCNKAVAGLGASHEDNFAKCCASMLLQSNCRDPKKPFYTYAEVKGVDDKGKLIFGQTREGDKPPPFPMPDLREIKLAPDVE